MLCKIFSGQHQTQCLTVGYKLFTEEKKWWFKKLRGWDPDSLASQIIPNSTSNASHQQNPWDCCSHVSLHYCSTEDATFGAGPLLYEMLLHRINACLPPELVITHCVGQGVQVQGVLQGNTEWHRSEWQPVVWVQPGPNFSKERAWRRSARHHVGSFGVLTPSLPVCIPSAHGRAPLSRGASGPVVPMMLPDIPLMGNVLSYWTCLCLL